MTLLVATIACLIPIVSYPFVLAYYHQTGRAKTSALLTGLTTSAFAYGYIADQGNDIYRHILNLRYYTDVPFYKAFDAAFLKSVYVWDIWQWIIAHLHNDFLMQASGAFVGYTLVAYMIFDYGKWNECSKKNINIAFFIAYLCMSPLSMAIGIRSGNAMVFCAFALYLYFVHNKSYLFTAALILISIFLHHSMVVVLALWFVYAVFKKKPVIGASLVVAMMVTFTNYEQYISMLMGGGSIFEALGEDLQTSVITYYRGERFMGLHYYVTVAVQTALVLLFFVRGGGYGITYPAQSGSREWDGSYYTPQNQLVPDRLHCSSCQFAGIAYI